MELAIEIGVKVADLVVSFFSGDEWKKICKFTSK